MVRLTPTALEIGGLSLHWYGLIIACGMALAVALAMRRERALGLPRDTALDLALWGIPSAIVGARLYFVAFSWPLYADQPLRALYVWEGGLAIYGGLIGGVLAGWIYARAKRLPFWRLADLAAPSFALGQAVGRWGNFVNQEAYGEVAPYLWQQRFPVSIFIRADRQWHYATFFYESAWCLLVAAALLALSRRGAFRRDGECFTAYAALYALERAFVEGLRTDSLTLGPVRVSQLLSLAVLVACAVATLLRARDRRLPAALLMSALAVAALLLTGLPWIALAAAGAYLGLLAAHLCRRERAEE